MLYTELFTDGPVVTWNLLGPQLVAHRMKIAHGGDGSFYKTAAEFSFLLQIFPNWRG